jgi:hypothetical protein
MTALMSVVAIASLVYAILADRTALRLLSLLVSASAAAAVLVLIRELGLPPGEP